MVKYPSASAGDSGDSGSIPELERFPEGGNSNILQYFCLENPMDRGAWWAIVQGISNSQPRLKRVSTHTYMCMNPGISTIGTVYLGFK